MGAEGCAHVVGLPRADAETVGHIGGIGGVDTLALQSGSRLVVLAAQEGIGHVEDVLTLRPIELEL